MPTNEIADIAGYEGLYKVATDGRIFSVEKKKFLKRNRHSRGIRSYHSVWLKKYAWKDGQVVTSYKQHKVHRLVASAFIPNPEGKPEVNHKNGNRYDNRVENLEWVTHRENIIHAGKMGRMSRRGEMGTRAKLKNEQVTFIKNSTLPRKDLARRFGVCNSTVDHIKTGRNWKHLQNTV